MKTRTGFVSNSSSCSFVISKIGLTDDQISFIKNFETNLRGKVCHLGSWSFEERLHVPGSDPWDYSGDEEGIEELSFVFSADRDQVECDSSSMISHFEAQGIEVENLGCDC